MTLLEASSSTPPAPTPALGSSAPVPSALADVIEPRWWTGTPSLAGDEYRISTRGRTLEEEGFIHCSYEHQVRGVLDAFYADVDEVLILTIDPTDLDVRDEPPAPGIDERFPHIYGPLPTSAVTSIRRRSRR